MNVGLIKGDFKGAISCIFVSGTALPRAIASRTRSYMLACLASENTCPGSGVQFIHKNTGKVRFLRGADISTVGGQKEQSVSGLYLKE